MAVIFDVGRLLPRGSAGRPDASALIERRLTDRHTALNGQFALPDLFYQSGSGCLTSYEDTPGAQRPAGTSSFQSRPPESGGD